ncbi:hypothetical protein Tco_0222080 [Tanacetum coccineum]
MPGAGILVTMLVRAMLLEYSRGQDIGNWPVSAKGHTHGFITGYHLERLSYRRPRLECAYTVYPILPAIPNQSRIIWEDLYFERLNTKSKESVISLGLQVEFFEGWKPLSPLQLDVEEVMSE